jgi:hypothetical protein
MTHEELYNWDSMFAEFAEEKAKQESLSDPDDADE